MAHEMRCSSGKTSFESKELAEEALIQNHIRSNHRKGSGPQNVYECQDCGEWHFTSRPPASELFSDKDILNRMDLERRSYDWERKVK
ncbi:MAG: hypothetical protein GY816_04435 [Cytophagales bacterium]|nr:hypothetical protein [Cytophagales bacterium]